MTFLNKLRAKLKSDRGDSILVPALILSIAVGLVIGLVFDVVKNGYVRSERINTIQDSASAAVTMTDNRGSLNWSVVDKVVNTYEYNRFGERLYSSTSNTGIKHDTDVRETTESRVFDGYEKCSEDSKTGKKYPYYKITLDTGRGDSVEKKTVEFARTQKSVQQFNRDVPLNQKSIYRSVTVEVIDQTPNIMLGMAGMPCQKFDLTASAVTFSANKDLK